MTNERERFESIERAKRCGLSEVDAIAVRRIALTLHRWFERECNGEIWRDEESRVVMAPYSNYNPKDHKTGALKRLDKIMARYPKLRAWIQTDPRGGTIYLCKPEDATDSLYTRGVFIA